jgi:hypothetical protein
LVFSHLIKGEIRKSKLINWGIRGKIGNPMMESERIEGKIIIPPPQSILYHVASP